jgi:hypothetical protein
MIRTVAGWIAGLLLVHGAVSAAYVSTVGHDHRAVELDRAFLDDSRPLSVLVAGASHARNGVGADALGGLSIAVAGEHPVKTRYRLPWLLDRSERPIGAVVLELDAASFSSWKADEFAPEYVWGRYVPLMELGMLRGAPLDYAGKWLKARAVPYAGELNNLMFWRAGLRAFQDEDDTERFKGQPPAWMRKSGEEAARLHFEGHHPFDPLKVWAFQTLVAELRARDVHVVLVRFPVMADYAAVAESHGATAELRDELVAPLLSPGEVDELDYEAMFFDRPGAFYDGDHLNAQGRRALTRRLGADLRQLGVMP